MKGRPWTIYIDEKMLAVIKQVAKVKKVSVSNIVRMALERFLEEENRRQARQKFLEWLKNQEITQDRKEYLLQAWEEYQEKERGKGRDFLEVFK